MCVWWGGGGMCDVCDGGGHVCVFVCGHDGVHMCWCVREWGGGGMHVCWGVELVRASADLYICLC